jgi:MurNAc alpha-1-phosphate uridylyltransferase
MSGPGTPAKAMVLAAGLGLRMRPITETLPKPLIRIGGRSLLDRILDRLAEAGVEESVVNVHHLAHVIEEHIEDHLTQRRRPAVRLSHEAARLETGGGIAHALRLFDDRPFFAINGDVLWEDGAPPTLPALAAMWEAGRMDALLVLHPVTTARGYDGVGDFNRLADGRLQRRQGADAPYLFAGIQILHPRLFADAPPGPFSLNLLYDRAERAGRLFGLVHAGRWCHVGTPDDIPVAEAFLADAGVQAADATDAVQP